MKVAETKHVGILNFPGHLNQGANLTAYALQRAIRDMGHTAVNLHLRSNYVLVKDSRYTDFSDKNIVMSDDDSWGEFSMQRYNASFDTFIVGSDQVWRYIDGEEMFAWKTALEPCYYLGFAKPGKRRIAMAASFGRDDYSAPAHVRARSAEELKRFAAISVREESAVRLVKQIADVEVARVVDPVFYLTADDWNNFATPVGGKRNPGFVAYNSFFNSDSIEKMEMSGNEAFVKLLAGDTADWLASIRDARFVISDSYHVCCFCLIYGTPFAALTKHDQGNARFIELAQLFGFSPERIVDTSKTQDLSSAIKRIMELPFDRDAIHAKIASEKEKSYNWLKAALSAPIPEWTGASFHEATPEECKKEKKNNRQWKQQQGIRLRNFVYNILFYTCPIKRQMIREKHERYQRIVKNLTW